MSFYTSLNGMKNAQTSLGVISHNISNSETHGFKRSRTEFSEIVGGTALTNPRHDPRASVRRLNRSRRTLRLVRSSGLVHRWILAITG